MVGYVVVKNNFTGVESKINLDRWQKIKDRRDIKKAFSIIEEVKEPPEVTALLRAKK